jgi:streptogrisin B
MSIHPITLASALLAVGALLCAGAAPAAAQGAATISPGDELVTAAADGGQMCTLGYTFTNPGTGTAYGITAGHCNGHRSSSVTDRTTGAVGHFVLTVGNPDEALDDDYGLIDFGASRSLPIMYGMPVSGISAPDPTRAVCHDGIKTGVACGAVHSRLFGTQFATSGMPQSIPGDSGGPVWQLGPDNSATVIGIWLGEHIEPNGPRYGRFTGLTDVLADITDYSTRVGSSQESNQ